MTAERVGKKSRYEVSSLLLITLISSCYVSGALLIKRSSAHVLTKTYFGGGTVKVSLAKEPLAVSKDNISEK